MPDTCARFFFRFFALVLSFNNHPTGLLNSMDAIIDDDVKNMWESIGMVVGIGFGVVVIR